MSGPKAEGDLAAMRRRTSITTLLVVGISVLTLFAAVYLWRCSNPLLALGDGASAAGDVDSSGISGLEGIVDSNGYEVIGADSERDIYEIAREGRQDEVLDGFEDRLIGCGWVLVETEDDESSANTPIRTYSRMGSEGGDSTREELIVIAQQDDTDTLLLLQMC